MEEKTRNLEKAIADGKGTTENLNRLRRFGVFVKSYNMSHLLATRYKVSENFGIDSNMGKIDNIESDIKEAQTKLNKLDAEKDKDAANEIRKKMGELRDSNRTALNHLKVSTGTELFNRFMRGFVRTSDAEANEKISNTQFLFTRLKF